MIYNCGIRRGTTGAVPADVPPELSRPAGWNSPAGDAAYAVLVEVVKECQRAGVAPDGDSQTLARLLWATAHGLAALWLDGPLDQHGANTGTPAPQFVQHIGDLLQAMLAGATHSGSRPDQPSGEPFIG